MSLPVFSYGRCELGYKRRGPFKGKLCYVNEDQAKAALEQHLKRDANVKSYYKCGCGFYHLTKQAQRQKK